MNAPLHLPAVPADAAQLLGVVANRLGRGHFEFGGAAWRFELAPLGIVPPRATDTFVVEFTWGGAALRLVAPVSLPALLLAHRMTGAEPDVTSDELALAGFELAWDELLERLEQLGGRRVQLVAAGRRAAPALAHGEFAFALSLDSESARDGVHAELVTDGAGLALLGLLARRLPAPARPAPDPELPLRMRIELAGVLMSLNGLRRLNVHDVLLPDEAIDADSPRLLLRPDDRHVLRARLSADTLIAESSLEKIRMTASVADEPPGSPARIEDIDVRLTFDLGDKLMTVGTLAAVQPGQVLALDAALPRLVAIRANGRLVGRGELVRLDDRIGVRVLELAGREGVEA
jgi:type III secretion protein Q